MRLRKQPGHFHHAGSQPMGSIKLKTLLIQKFTCNAAHTISPDFVILATKVSIFGNISLNSRKKKKATQSSLNVRYRKDLENQH